MEDAYKSDFELFLSHTDEKSVLLKEIAKEIEKYQVKSLLDIGAGNGLLSIPLSKKVNRYVAVEQKESFVEKLRDAGIKVIKGIFPLEISGHHFDMALTSHSLSYEKDTFKPFIKEAWNLINPNGIFLIITYRGQEDDWTNLMKNLGRKYEDRNRVGYNQIVELLASMGDVKTRKVITNVRTDNIEDMIQALSFVASDGQPERKAWFMEKRTKVEKILSQNYQNDKGYFFPFQHFFITTQKT